MRIITLEEHFVSQRFLDTAGIDLGGQRGLDLSGTEVTDLGALRRTRTCWSTRCAS